MVTSSRDWTCPHCQQTNLELLPDPLNRENQTKWGAGNILGSHESEAAEDIVPADDSSATSVVEAEQVPTKEQEPRRSSKKPHILLDTAICILLVLLFVIICRRVV